MTSRLALFPLKVVLFPGEPLPLHIFEPRYRQLLADCLDGDERFGITPTPDPGPGVVGCVARIRAAQPLPDGRSNIVVLGENRFAVRNLLDEGRPYLVGAVEEFGDREGTEPLPEERGHLRELAETYREALAVLTDSPGDPGDWAEDSEGFSFQVAALAELELDIERELLRVRSTRERTRALLTLLPPLIHLAQDRAAIHVRARSNGTGGHGHDIVTDE
jgi:ATP-dependent Lon protease